MKNKIIWGVLIAASAALLIAGAVNRTMARSEVGSVATNQASLQQRRGQAVSVPSAAAEADYVDQEALPGEASGEGKGPGSGQGRGPSVEAGSVSSASGGPGQSAGRGQGGAGAESAPLAEASSLETLHGTVTEASEELLLLAQANGDVIEISGRAWRYALENGFVVRQKDTLTITGFFDGDTYEPIAIANEATGQEIQVREASGRPMWAGRGRGQSGT